MGMSKLANKSMYLVPVVVITVMVVMMQISLSKKNDFIDRQITRYNELYYRAKWLIRENKRLIRWCGDRCHGSEVRCPILTKRLPARSEL